MPSFFGFPFEQPSEEDKEEIRRAHDQNQMELDEFRHSFQRLFEELDRDQLRTVVTMLNLLVNHTGSIVAASWEGMALHALKSRYNVCIACGVNHDEEVPVLPEPPQSMLELDRPLSPGFVPTIFPTEEVDDPSGHTPITPEDRENMEKYHLDDAYDVDTKEFLYFMCTGIKGMKGSCGVTYPSIEDRMLKPPEHCSGCFSRMAQG